jgi:hypothetical protein
MEELFEERWSSPDLGLIDFKFFSFAVRMSFRVEHWKPFAFRYEVTGVQMPDCNSGPFPAKDILK